MNIYLEMNKEYIATGKLPGFAKEKPRNGGSMLEGFLDAIARGELDIPGIKVIKGNAEMLKHLMKDKAKRAKSKSKADDKKV